MKHQVQARYPASPEIVIKMFTDKGFHTRKLDALGMPYKVLTHEFDGQTFRIRVERKVPVQMPGGKKAEATVTNEETWHVGSRTGSVKVEAGAMPLECACTTVIADGGSETLVTYDWTVKSKIPLLGGQIEKMAVADMDTRSADETRIAIELIADYR